MHQCARKVVIQDAFYAAFTDVLLYKQAGEQMRQSCTEKLCCTVSLLTILRATWVQVQCLNNGLAVSPPMGWNTWNAWHDQIDEELVRTAADILVSSGLQTAGFEYLIIDGRRLCVRPLMAILASFHAGACTDMLSEPCLPHPASVGVTAARSDGWATRQREGTGPIQANSTRFPNGIKAVADYVHAKGRLFLETFESWKPGCWIAQAACTPVPLQA